MKIIKVKNCNNCVFSDTIFDYDLKGNRFVSESQCLAPSEIHDGIHYNIKTYYQNYKSPKWCPLNKTSVKIEKIIN